MSLYLHEFLCENNNLFEPEIFIVIHHSWKSGFSDYQECQIKKNYRYSKQKTYCDGLNRFTHFPRSHGMGMV